MPCGRSRVSSGSKPFYLPFSFSLRRLSTYCHRVLPLPAHAHLARICSPRNPSARPSPALVSNCERNSALAGQRGRRIRRRLFSPRQPGNPPIGERAREGCVQVSRSWPLSPCLSFQDGRPNPPNRPLDGVFHRPVYSFALDNPGQCSRNFATIQKVAWGVKNGDPALPGFRPASVPVCRPSKPI